MTDGQSGSGRVLRLRNLAMIENIRRAESPAWRERLEQRQVTPVGLRASRSHAPRTKAAAERCGREAFDSVSVEFSYCEFNGFA
jgi:hypothetical protein